MEETNKIVVKVSESFSLKIKMIFDAFNLHWEGTMFYERFNENEIFRCVKGIECRVTFFGLLKRNIPFEKHIKLGRFSQEKYDSNIFFYVYGNVNMPLATILATNISLAIGKSIDVMLVKQESEKIENCQDDPLLLNHYRQFLECEQRRIESELAEVHKRLNELEGDGGPYRALSAIK